MPEWEEGNFDLRKYLSHSAVILWTVVFLFGFAVLLSSVVFIPAGHEGVRFNRLTGHIAATTLKQGWQLVSGATASPPW